MADLAISGTTTFVVGASSGLDTATLIEIAVQEVTVDADEIDLQIDDNELVIAAYEELSTLATAFQDAIDALTIIDDFDSDDVSVLDDKTGFLVADDGTDVTTVLNVALDDGVAEGEYEIEVQQKAEEMIVTGNTVADSTASLSYTGSFTIGLDGMTAEQVDVTSDMSLDDIAEAINATTDTSGVEATVIKVSETEYQLVLTGTETNQSITTASVSGDTILANLGLTDGAGTFLNVTQDAQEAIIVLDGITITRDDNSFDDVLDGVDLDVSAAAPGTNITLEITNDTEGVKEAIEAFVDAYNDLRFFIVEQQTVSEDGDASGALFSDLLLQSLSYQVTDLLGLSYTDNNVIEGLADIGISFISNNYLAIDDTDLDDAILDNFDELVELFSSSSTLSSDSIAILENSSTTQSFDFALDITADGSGDISSVSVGGDASLFTFDGTIITGAAGSDYEGLSFSYQGGITQSIDVLISQGIADILYQSIDAYTNSSTGLLTTEVSSLESQNDDLESEASDIRVKAEEVRAYEIERYAAFEVQIAAAELALSQIRAILGTNDDDD